MLLCVMSWRMTLNMRTCNLFRRVVKWICWNILLWEICLNMFHWNSGNLLKTWSSDQRAPPGENSLPNNVMSSNKNMDQSVFSPVAGKGGDGGMGWGSRLQTKVCLSVSLRTAAQQTCDQQVRLQKPHQAHYNRKGPRIFHPGPNSHPSSSFLSAVGGCSSSTEREGRWRFIL